MNLQQKMTLLFVGSVALPALLISGVAILVYHSILYPEYMAQEENAADQLALSLDSRIQSYELLLSRISADSELQDRLSQSYATQESRWETLRYLTRVYEPVAEYLPGIVRLRFYVDNPSLPEDGGILWRPGIRPLLGQTERAWYDDAVSSGPALRWTYAPDLVEKGPHFALTRQIVTLSGAKLGILWALVDSRALVGDFSDRAARNGRGFVLADRDGSVCGGSEQELFGERLYGAKAQSSLRGKDRIVVQRTLANGWSFAESIPRASTDKDSLPLIIAAAALALAFILIDSFALFLIMRDLRKRLVAVSSHMGSVALGDFVQIAGGGSKDEIAVIEDGFNNMSRKLNALMEEVIAARTLEREESFKALQAQINPHFLYNSLGVLRWMALDGNTGELCAGIDALARFYRLSLKDAAGFIPIADELEHVKAYLEVQQIRFKHKVAVSIEVESEVEKLYTIKLMLQPLVENCFQHGRVAKIEGGRIALAIARSGESVRFTVEDNGVGIDPDVLEALRAGIAEPSKEGGYGLRNVMDRLKICFGDRSKIEFESSGGAGTRISIELPACETAPELGK
jgi:Predicted signal transduction protein with a C-terminal ATPase domain